MGESKADLVVDLVKRATDGARVEYQRNHITNSWLFNMRRGTINFQRLIADEAMQSLTVEALTRTLITDWDQATRQFLSEPILLPDVQQILDDANRTLRGEKEEDLSWIPPMPGAPATS